MARASLKRKEGVPNSLLLLPGFLLETANSLTGAALVPYSEGSRRERRHESMFRKSDLFGGLPHWNGLKSFEDGMPNGQRRSGSSIFMSVPELSGFRPCDKIFPAVPDGM